MGLFFMLIIQNWLQQTGIDFSLMEKKKNKATVFASFFDSIVHPVFLSSTSKQMS